MISLEECYSKHTESHRHKSKVKGFTLPELMVVILIIAILLAVSVPIYLQGRNRAVVRAAQHRLGSAIKAAKTIHGGGLSTNTGISDDQTGVAYSAMTEAQIQAEAGAITMGVAAAGSRNVDLLADPAPTTNYAAFLTYDANGTARYAEIEDDGSVNYSDAVPVDG